MLPNDPFLVGCIEALWGRQVVCQPRYSRDRRVKASPAQRSDTAIVLTPAPSAAGAAPSQSREKVLNDRQLEHTPRFTPAAPSRLLDLTLTQRGAYIS